MKKMKWITLLVAALMLTSSLNSVALAGDRIKIEVMRNGSGLPDPDNDPIKKVLDEKLNIDINLTVYPMSDEYINALMLRMAAGNYPDIIKCDGQLLSKLVAEDLLLDLTELYKKELLPVAEYLGQDSLTYGNVNGRYFGFPSPQASTRLSYNTLWVRQDWLDKLGLSLPSTIEEIKKVALAFINDDPDGNNKADTVGLSGNLFETFASIFGAYNVGTPKSMYVKDGELTFSYYDPDMPKALAAAHDLYASGCLDPEVFAALNPAYLREKAIQGQTGLLNISWSELVKDEYLAQMSALNSNTKWVQLPPLTGFSDNPTDGVQNIGSPSSMFAIPANLTAEKLERVIALFNFLASDEGRMLTKYGIEDVNYEVIEGKPQRLSDTSFKDIGHVWLYQFLGRAPESEYLSVRFPNQREYIDFVDSQPRIYSLEGYVPAMDGYVLADAEKYAAEEFVKFINGSRDLSDYNDFLETLKTTFGYGIYMDYAEGVLKKLNVL